MLNILENDINKNNSKNLNKEGESAIDSENYVIALNNEDLQNPKINPIVKQETKKNKGEKENKETTLNEKSKIIINK